MLYGIGARLFTMPLKHDKDLLFLCIRIETTVEFEHYSTVGYGVMKIIFKMLSFLLSKQYF